MESQAVFTYRLEAKTYRDLQKIAKAMRLPSNYKKVYLIELIVAKKYSSEAEVNDIIERVREERLNLSKVKKRPRGKARNIKRQGPVQKILAARNSVCYSPPITATPKRPSNYRQDSPETLPITPVNPKRNAASASDRILRSYTRPNYSLTSDIQELRAQRRAPLNRNTKSIIVKRNKCYVNKRNYNYKLKQELLISHIREIIRATGPRKRQRIHLAQSEEIILSTDKCVSIRRNDGSYAEINAVYQNNNTNALKINNTKSPEITFQDKLDAAIPEDLTNSNTYGFNIFEYVNVTDINVTNNTGTTIICDHDYNGNYAASDIQQVDYEEKLRVEQVIDQRDYFLPKISDVFPQFSYLSDATQPIYVQVADACNVPSYPTHVDRSNINTAGPETLYNMQTNAPLRQSNVDTIRCVSAHAVPTVTALPDPATPAGGALSVTSPALDDNNNQYPDVDIHLQEFLQLIANPKMKDFSGSSPRDTVDTPYGINELYEDALEMISQDTDYLESVGLSEPVQCVFCGWAGIILLLDHHIRKDHAQSIQKVDKNEWNITYTLQSLLQCDVWLHRVIEHDRKLYLLSVKHEHPDFFMATFSLISLDLLEPNENSVTMTLCNKRTGEPFSWTGQVRIFPPSSPNDNTGNGLKLQLADLDLVSNKPLSYDIHVIMFVKISPSTL
ncbi:uncharacterized protein [Maniola hyperantus]|uniref:uncharacterized protein isoform X1 n=1 Tax=Aphantopus hyperantus TaxID=2795564 RepID=UPI0021330ECD